MTGQPAISLPLAWSKGGLPIGVQFVGRFGEEHLLLQLAAQIEKADLEQEAAAGLRLKRTLEGNRGAEAPTFAGAIIVAAQSRRRRSSRFPCERARFRCRNGPLPRPAGRGCSRARPWPGPLARPY